MLTARQIVERIAPNESAMLDSLFKPVTFSDGTQGTYSGFISKVTKTEVLFAYMNRKELMVNARGVLGQYSMHNGKRYYFYVLDPFGPDVRYSVECEVGKILADKYIR